MAAEDYVEPAASRQHQGARAPGYAARRRPFLRNARGYHLVIRAETGQNDNLPNIRGVRERRHQIAVIARNAATAPEAVGDKCEYFHAGHFPDVAFMTQNGVPNKVSARIAGDAAQKSQL